MKEKAKRKGNPRRQILLRLFLGIGILVVLIAAAVTALRPQGAQIVYIAPDDNGIDQVWLMNLNNPEHQRQLTDLHETSHILSLETTFNGSIVISSTAGETEAFTISQYDFRSRQLDIIWQFDIRVRWRLHPQGHLIAFISSNDPNFIQIIDTQTADIIHAFYVSHHIRNFHWSAENGNVILSSGQNHQIDEWLVIATDIVSGEQAEFISPLIDLTGLDRCAFLSPDGNRCAWNISDGADPIAPELVGIYEVGSDEQLIIPVDYAGRPLWQNLSTVTSYFYGWYPDSQHFLYSDTPAEDFDDDSQYRDFITTTLNVYNLETDTSETIQSFPRLMRYESVAFNHDATQLLISVQDREVFEQQVILLNLETGEETVLPISGHSPQWVNGGR